MQELLPYFRHIGELPPLSGASNHTGNIAEGLWFLYYWAQSWYHCDFLNIASVLTYTWQGNTT